MVKDAETHAAEDAQRKEEIETRNNADSLVNATQQTLDELGDKAPADAKAAAESAISEAKRAQRVTASRGYQASVELQRAGFKLAEVVYSQNGGDPAAAAAAAAGAQGGAAPADDDTIEADYEVVDDDKKEGK